MGAFEFLTFLTGKVVNNITGIRGKGKSAESQPPLQITSKASIETICHSLVQAFNAAKPTTYVQTNP
jgi:hypothetical protein